MKPFIQLILLFLLANITAKAWLCLLGDESENVEALTRRSTSYAVTTLCLVAALAVSFFIPNF